MKPEERLVRLDPKSGEMVIVALVEALSDLSEAGPYSEVVMRLRRGQAVRVPGGRVYRTLTSLNGIDREQLLGNSHR